MGLGAAEADTDSVTISSSAAMAAATHAMFSCRVQVVIIAEMHGPATHRNQARTLLDRDLCY
jgi:hypothetical protein